MSRPGRLTKGIILYSAMRAVAVFLFIFAATKIPVVHRYERETHVGFPRHTKGGRWYEPRMRRARLVINDHGIFIRGIHQGNVAIFLFEKGMATRQRTIEGMLRAGQSPSRSAFGCKRWFW